MSVCPRPTGRPWLGRVLVSAAVLALYVTACALPAAQLDREGANPLFRLGSVCGFEALLAGWLPPLTVPWSANLLLLGGWCFLLGGRYRAAAWLGAAGAVLTLSAWWFDVPRLLVGFYLWQGSLAALAERLAGQTVVVTGARGGGFITAVGLKAVD